MRGARKASEETLLRREGSTVSSVLKRSSKMETEKGHWIWPDGQCRNESLTKPGSVECGAGRRENEGAMSAEILLRSPALRLRRKGPRAEGQARGERSPFKVGYICIQHVNGPVGTVQ